MCRGLLILFGAFLISTTALAIDEPEDLGNGVLGAFTAPYAGDGVDNFLTGVVPGEPVQVHFTLYHHRLPTAKPGGFECSWELLPGAASYQVLDLTFGIPGCYNFGDEHDLLVGVSELMIFVDQPIHLFTITIMFTESPDGESIRLQPSSLESIEGEMVYVDYLEPDELLIMRPNSVGQDLEESVFWFNPTVATEPRSLTGVKALFD
jgi:hypothetical protein